MNVQAVKRSLIEKVVIRRKDVDSGEVFVAVGDFA